MVNKELVIQESGFIMDGKTGEAVKNALISIPSKGITAKTNKNGQFQIDIPDKRPLIMSVQAEGYKPFSLIIDENDVKSPMKIIVQKKKRKEIVLDTSLHHLGDNRFSERSANSEDFSASANGHYYFKEFYLKNDYISGDLILKIGSIIGIDTKKAQSMRQSNVFTAFSSPVEVFFNSKKIGEIDFNGNNHSLKIPYGLVKINEYNHIRIETGVNLTIKSRKDYDDIEFIHLILECL